jgi:gliding motility-associated lipoprotein GldD
MKNYSLLLLAFGFFLCACDGKEKLIPKPPTYLKIDLPERDYSFYKDTCSFSFRKPSYFNVKSVDKQTCNKDIQLEQLNGTIHLSVINMDTSLAAYVNYAIDKVDEHKVKAIAINDTNFINKDNKAYGTFFELQGNVATPFQFYITDSVSRFLSGVIYFNSRPNYDSIKPVLNFVKEDLYEMMETMQWDE